MALACRSYIAYVQKTGILVVKISACKVMQESYHKQYDIRSSSVAEKLGSKGFTINFSQTKPRSQCQHAGWTAPTRKPERCAGEAQTQ